MDEDIKAEYFSKQIREKVAKAIERQRKIAGEKIAGLDATRGALIRESLEGLSVSTRKEGGGVMASMSYPLQLRFFDMKRIRDWRIYDRVLWGMAYKDLLHDIKYEYRDWLREHYSEQLKKMNQ